MGAGSPWPKYPTQLLFQEPLLDFYPNRVLLGRPCCQASQPEGKEALCPGP